MHNFLPHDGTGATRIYADGVVMNLPNYLEVHAGAVLSPTVRYLYQRGAEAVHQRGGNQPPRNRSGISPRRPKSRNFVNGKVAWSGQLERRRGRKNTHGKVNAPGGRMDCRQ